MDYSWIKLWIQRKLSQTNNRIKHIHRKKSGKLTFTPDLCNLNIDKIIHNLSSKVLSADEKEFIVRS